MSFYTKHVKLLAVCAFVLVGTLTYYFGTHSGRAEQDTFFALDTFITFELYGKDSDKALEKAKEIIRDAEQKLSPYNEESIIYKYNHAQPGEKFEDEELTELIEDSIYISEISDGAFDITLFPVTELWDINNASAPPADEKIQEALQNTGYKKIEISDGCLIKTENLQLDLGGIAKGYVSNRLRMAMAGFGINKGIINLGGNVILLGEKAEGEPWNIGIANPDDPNEVITSVYALDTNVVTSGAYQRYFEYEGKMYHHILSPKNGYPSESGLKSVTVIDGNGVLCDGLSTAVYVLGKDKGTELLEKCGVRAVLVTDSGEVLRID